MCISTIGVPSGTAVTQLVVQYVYSKGSRTVQSGDFIRGCQLKWSSANETYSLSEAVRSAAEEASIGELLEHGSSAKSTAP